MALRNMSVDIGFNVNEGPLKRANQSADDFKENVEDSTSTLDDLGSQAETSGDTMRDEFEESTDVLGDLGYQAEDSGEMIVDSSEDAADALGDLGSQAGDASDVISDASLSAADSIGEIGSSAGNAGDAVSDAESQAVDSFSGIQESSDDTGGSFKDLGANADKWIRGAAIGAVAALGGAFIVAAADATSSMTEIEDSMYTFQAETGKSIEKAEDFAGVLEDLHTGNTDSYGELADAATIVSQRFDVEGEKLQGLTQDYLDYTKVTGQSEDAIEGLSKIQKQFGIDTDDASGMLDKFLTVSQDTGAPVEDLQRNIEQMGPSLQAAGLSLDETLGLMGMFEESGVDSQRALRGMRTAMNQVENPKELKGMLTDMMEMSDETDRTEAAIDTFGGTAGPQMALAFGEGQDAFDNMVGAISDSEGTVSEASDAFDKQLGERFKLLMRDVIDPFRETVGPELTDAMDSMMGWVESNLPAIRSVAEPIFQGIADSIGFVVENFDILGPAIGTALLVIGVPAFISLTTAAWSLAAGVLAATWPILAIGVAVGALVGIFIWAWQNWDQITEWFGMAMDWLGEKFSIGLQYLKDFFVNIFTGIRDFGINLWTGFSEMVLGIWQGFTTGVSNFVISLRDGITEGFNSVVDFGVEAWQGFSDGILDIWDGLVGGIKGFINSIITAVNSMIEGINSFEVDVPGWITSIPGVPSGMESFGFNISTIPHLADGGMVTDATLSVVGEGSDNEAVLPLNKNVYGLIGQGIAAALGFGGSSNDEQPNDTGNEYSYDEYSDYDEYNDSSEYNDYSIEIKEVKINVSGNASKEDGEKVGEGLKEYLEEHYGSLNRRVLTSQEG